MLDDAIEHRCRMLDISPGGVALLAPTRGRVGEHVICYLDHFGRIEGRVARLFEGGFAIEIQASSAKREKLSHQLAWHAGHSESVGHAGRKHDRLVPLKTRAVLHLPDGRHIAVQLLDFSVSGVALTCPVPLAIGEEVVLGRRPARVARTAQRLVALEFVTPLPQDDFDERIDF